MWHINSTNILSGSINWKCTRTGKHTVPRRPSGWLRPRAAKARQPKRIAASPHEGAVSPRSGGETSKHIGQVIIYDAVGPLNADISCADGAIYECTLYITIIIVDINIPDE